jgi:hypothetical protein
MASADKKTGRHSADDELEERVAGHYSAWDEIDDMRTNFFLGGWATRRLREINESRKQRDREELEKKKRAEQEGREYKSPLQLELEDAARKREEKEKLEEEKHRQNEAGRRG